MIYIPKRCLCLYRTLSVMWSRTSVSSSRSLISLSVSMFSSMFLQSMDHHAGIGGTAVNTNNHSNAPLPANWREVLLSNKREDQIARTPPYPECFSRDKIRGKSIVKDQGRG